MIWKTITLIVISLIAFLVDIELIERLTFLGVAAALWNTEHLFKEIGSAYKNLCQRINMIHTPSYSDWLNKDENL